MPKYQAYAWNGKEYIVVSVPIYDTEAEAIAEAESIILDRSNDSVLNSIRYHWKEKPIIAKEKYYGMV